ncbi:MAG: hypothetical protein PHV82_09150, partial [Victivallaceae bacterium]|nr:hypothetical protein [Victivallaceae bacterium]
MDYNTESDNTDPAPESKEPSGLTAVSKESLQLSRKLTVVLRDIFMCQKQLQLYHPEHPKVLDSAKAVVDGLHEAMLDRKIISLDFSEKHFIYDDIIIDHDHSFAAEQLRDFFECREISRISFHEGTPAEAIIALLDVLDNAPEGEKRRQLNERLKS